MVRGRGDVCTIDSIKTEGPRVDAGADHAAREIAESKSLQNPLADIPTDTENKNVERLNSVSSR